MFRLSREPPWNPWYRGENGAGQIRTIAGVSRTALSVMVVVLPLILLSLSLSLYPVSLTFSFAIESTRALIHFHPLARLNLSSFPPRRFSHAYAIYEVPSSARPQLHELLPLKIFAFAYDSLIPFNATFRHS